MDTRTEQAVDKTLEKKLLYNEHIVQHPTFGPVKLRRPNAEQEALIAERRRAQTHKDMLNPDVLARDRLEQLAIEKGMWTPEATARIQELTQKTGETMGLLDAIGFQDFEIVLKDYQDVIKDLLSLYQGDENTDVRDAIIRFYNLDEKPVAKDRTLIADAATTTRVDDLMEKGDLYRTQLDILSEMFKIRKELQELHMKQARVFLDSLENRSDRAEELAVIYYCSVTADTEKYLWPNYEDIKKARVEDVEFLMTEYHYFRHGITEEFKDTLGKYGFIKRLTDTTDSSAGSPDQPQSKSDGESVEKVPQSSSEVTESALPKSTTS